MLAVFKLSLLAILLPIATLAAHVGRDHSDLARRVEGNVDLHARQWNGYIKASKLSFYDGETGMAYVFLARFCPQHSTSTLTAALAAISSLITKMCVFIHERASLC